MYLDHNATSPPTKEHLNELFVKLTQCLGNPSSPHSIGREASVVLTDSRRAVAKALGVDVGEVIFVSGGSEGDSLGTVAVLRQNDIALNKQHVITSSIEHPAIKEPLDYLRLKEGLNLTYSKVENGGAVSFVEFIKSITLQTTLITIMAANNEIGTIQPVKKIGDYLHYKRWGILANPVDKIEFDNISLHLNNEISIENFRKIHFHVDGVQAFGKIPAAQWLSLGVDSCAISAHKIGALQGSGALFLRRGRKFKPFVLGGAQEKNRRAGTENLPGIISFGLIAKKMVHPEWYEQLNKMDCLRRILFEKLAKLPHIVMNSPCDNVVPNTINFSLYGKKFKGEDLLVQLDLDGVCASSGSACSSGANVPSSVILALGKSVDLAKNAIRFSLSPSTSINDINKAIYIVEKYLTI